METNSPLTATTYQSGKRQALFGFYRRDIRPPASRNPLPDNELAPEGVHCLLPLSWG
jgi:hypothetical protein